MEHVRSHPRGPPAGLGRAVALLSHAPAVRMDTVGKAASQAASWEECGAPRTSTIEAPAPEGGPRSRPPAPSAAPAPEAPTRRTRDLAAAAKRLFKHPRLMPYHRLILAVRADQPRAALPPPRPRRLAGRRRERPLRARGTDDRELHRGGPHPPAERPQRPLRARRSRIAVLAAVDPMEHLEGASRRRHPRRCRARRNGVARRVHLGGDRCPRGSPRERLHHDARPLLLPRRAGGARRRLRGPAGEEPRPQRVRDVPPARRLDGHRALLGAHARNQGAELAGRDAGRPDGERRVALAAAAARRE